MNQVIAEQNTGSHLYSTGDEGQECIVLYKAEEWPEQFRQLLGMDLGQP